MEGPSWKGGAPVEFEGGQGRGDGEGGGGVGDGGDRMRATVGGQSELVTVTGIVAFAAIAIGGGAGDEGVEERGATTIASAKRKANVEGAAALVSAEAEKQRDGQGRRTWRRRRRRVVLERQKGEDVPWRICILSALKWKWLNLSAQP